MESGLPMLNCLLQHTLRSLCLSSESCSSTSSKWVYAIFWRILPRNFPPPKWEFGGSALDRSKGNKRNWILVWEDGFCDFHECEKAASGCIAGRFGLDLFFKMSHEVYSYGEGLVGKVGADNSHKWVFRDNATESDPNLISSWNSSIEPQPRAWESQFKSGIQTIAVFAVREGVVQLGSFDKVQEDLNLVINVQRKFSYLHSMPGIFAVQRPYLPSQHPYVLKPDVQMIENQSTGLKRLFSSMLDESSIKSINLGWNTPQHPSASGSPVWPIPPLLPSTSCSLRTFKSKLPSNSTPRCEANECFNSVQLMSINHPNPNTMKATNSEVKIETSSQLDAAQETEEKPSWKNPGRLGFEDGMVTELGFRLGETSQNGLSLN
ncbi:protein RICE SALT SENSITIVE 3-like [Cucurbita pepo subsp. pepo]|uniref:protein RICE SALT SENSITIVE 3-like n=1 Tax=Cucurbita pepo subsp. pepo TaxID=3664 RepID=UPI000C9D923A|nr:protein RICE SALT SENSITIVE 3-like [Cucurbita pepo subsp. pepo]